MSKLSTQIAVAIVCFLLGILLVSQFRTQEKIASEVRAQSPQNQLTLLGSLIESNARLRDEVIKLQGQLRAIESTSEPAIDSMSSELAHLKVVNGLVESRGPGVRVILDAQLESYWLHDLINELRNAGAEGISLNNQRLRTTSIIRGTAQAPVLDGVALARPYVVDAIGDQEALFTVLNRPGGLILQLRAQYGLAATAVHRQPELLLPAYEQEAGFHIAHPVP